MVKQDFLDKWIQGIDIDFVRENSARHAETVNNGEDIPTTIKAYLSR